MAPQPESIPFRGIYAIRHVRSGKLYIGSAANISTRWQTHRSQLGRGVHHSRHLQRAWNRDGADAFVFEILETVRSKDELIRREQEYLDDFLTWQSDRGYNTHRTAGSPLGTRASAETRAKLSAAHKGRAFSAEHRANLGKASRRMSAESREKIARTHRGKVVSAETRQKLSTSARNRSRECFKAVAEANRRRTWTPEMRKKMSAAKRGRGHTDESREKIAAAKRGTALSPEVRAKISAARKGHAPSPETRARLSASRRGKPRSPETKAKISASRRASIAQARITHKLTQQIFVFD